MLHLAPFTRIKEFTTGIERQAVLRCLLSNMQFEKHLDHPSALLCLTVNLPHELHRVNSLNHRHIRCNVFYLIRLQMTDEMPLDILGQRLVLLTQFLLVTLTEDALSLLIGGLYIFVGVILGNCHKAYTLWQCVKHLMKL